MKKRRLHGFSNYKGLDALWGFAFITFCVIATTSVQAQELVGSLTKDEYARISLFDDTQDLNQTFSMRHADKKGTRYLVYDHDFKIIHEADFDRKFSRGDMLMFSSSGKRFLLKDGKRLMRSTRINEGEDLLFDDVDYNADISENATYKPFLGKTYADLTPINFLNDNHFISIGRKEGKENYKDGNFKKMEVFMLKRSMDVDTDEYIPIKAPERYSFGHNTPNVVYANNDFFILVYVTAFNDRSHIYRPVYYNYDGEILKQFEVEYTLPDDALKFGYLNLNGNSFKSFRGYDLDGSNSTIQAYIIGTDDSNVNLSYDVLTDSFYAFGGIINKGDDAIQLVRFDNEGNKIWEAYKKIKGSNMRYLNSFNRVLTFVSSSEFVAMHFKTYKGKYFNNMNIFDLDTGELLKSGNYKKKEIKKKGLYSSKLICMDTWSQEFNDLSNTLKSSKGKERYCYGAYTTKGFLAGIYNEKEEIVRFYNWKL